ncbi:MAG: TonB-dependent receptor [Chitinophagaceae bacterium]|nr:TonB-dependent receptor [Chitinophagaceae bacterium]
MNFRFFISAFACYALMISLTSWAQGPGGRNGMGQMLKGRFYGKVVEAKSGKPIEYASVQLLQSRFDSVSKKRKEVVISGMLTKANGEFSLDSIPVFGQSTLRITVIGFKTFEQKVSFDFKPGGMNGDFTEMLAALDKDLGNIKIEFEEKELENVTVTSTSNPGLRLAIDKKVFNVDKNIVSAGGTAVDVMRNIPSLNVDIDGNITMRNNSPQIFVDGRPTTLTLDQIPADIIENVEIITNPSAKYDASGGMAGIINVVLKKNKKVGYNGNVRSNIDSRARVGLGGDINVRQEKVNFFLSGNVNQRKTISWGNTDRTTFGNPTTELFQRDKNIGQGTFMFGRAGFDYFIDNRNTISLSANAARGQFRPNTTSTMETDFMTNPLTETLAGRYAESRNQFRNLGTMLSFKHLFPQNGHELTADITYNFARSNNFNRIKTDSLDFVSKNILKSYSQQQQGKGSNENIVFQVDYTKPLGEKSKMEAGIRGSIRNVTNLNDFYFITPNGTLIYNPDFSINFMSTDRVYAAYTTFTNQIKNFGYQLGLRVESSDYNGSLPDKNQSFNIDFPISLFPSVFLTQKLKNEQELQLNYTRKINRPNFFQLFPYTDFSDSLNISRGNPGLKPEFTNSFELSYQKTFKKNKDNLLVSLYYKNTQDLITRFQVRETFPDTLLVNTFINASSSYIGGLELTLKTKINKWWDMTTNMNLFNSKVNTGVPGQPDQEAITSWFGKLNNNFKLAKNLTMQVSGEYQSRSILPPGGSGGGGGGGGFGRGGMFGGGGPGGGGGMFGQPIASQGFMRANYFVDLGFRFEFLKNRQASVSLNINDIFRTRRMDIYSESPFFIQNIFRRRDPQLVRINFNWRFGKFDPNLFKRKNLRNQDNPAGEMINNMGS